MTVTHYKNGELFVEDVSINAIAKKHGTPCYIYSQSALEQNWHRFFNAIKHVRHRICYAVKANNNSTLLNILSKLGSGFDIVSIGEARRVIHASGQPNHIIFSGVGKRIDEINDALLLGIYCFNVESWSELVRIDTLAKQQNKIANISLRINPDIKPDTHEHITTGDKENKFGISLSDTLQIASSIHQFKNVCLIGIASHIGSQISSLTPFIELSQFLKKCYFQLREMNIEIKHIDVGGGLGICYQNESPPSIEDYIQAILAQLSDLPIELIIEPGRALIGNTGILLTKIEYIKQTSHKQFAIVDAGMTDLMRPALYDAWHNITPVTQKNIPQHRYDIVGPVCESSDYLGKDRELAIEEGDLLVVEDTGAYGYSMSSNYNLRDKPSEILVHNRHTQIIRSHHRA